MFNKKYLNPPNSFPVVGNGAPRRFALFIFAVALCATSLGAEGIPNSKENPSRGGRLGIEKKTFVEPVGKSPEQMMQEILAFMNRYHSFAGTQAVLDNIAVIDRLQMFLREYKLIAGSMPADKRFLAELQRRIYRDLIERLRSYNKAAEAVAVQRKLMEASSSDRAMRTELAMLLSQYADGYAEAISVYLPLLQETPDDLNVRLGLARVQALKGETTAALQNYEMLLKARPQDYSVKLEYARLLVNANRTVETLEYLNQIAEASPDFHAARLEMARIAARSGDAVKADEQLSGIMNSPKVSLETKREVYAVYKELISKRDDLSVRRRYALFFSQDRRTFDWSISEYKAILQSGHAALEDRLGLARVLSWSQKFEPAIQLYREALASDPNAQPILAELAAVLRWSGRYAEALLVIDRLLIMQPASVAYTLEKARIFKESKKYDESFRLYQELIGADSHRLPIRIEYARALHESGRSEEACKEYAALLPLVADPEVHLEYARALASQHRYAESDRVYRQLIAEKPDDAELKLEYAQTLAWRNDFTTAAQYFSDGAKGMLAARKTLAKLLFWNGKYEEARAECLSLLNLKPNDMELQLDAARSLVRLEQFEQALNELEQLRAEYPKHKEIVAEYEQAVHLKKKKEQSIEKPNTEANEAEPQLMRPTPKPGSAKSSRSHLPLMIGPIETETKTTKRDLAQIARSKQLLQEETEDDRRRLEVANQLLWAKQYREAMRVFREIIADDPAELNAHVGLGEALLYIDDYSAAGRVFQHVLAADPNNLRARYGMAQIYAYGGKIQDSAAALKELKQVLSLSFTHVPAYETYGDLTREMGRSLNPFSQSHMDSDRYARFTVGTDYRYPVGDRTTLIGNYRYDVVQQQIRRRYLESDYASWFGRDWTGRSYEFGIRQRLNSTVQAQASLGGTNFNGGRSYVNASASLDFSPRRNHLFSVGYEREPAIFFLNTVMVLGAGLYGNRFQFAHQYSFRPQWEFTQNFQYTRLTSNHKYDAPDNTLRQASATLRYKLSRDFSLGTGYSWVGFRDRSPIYYSPRGDHGISGEFAFQKSRKVVGFGLSASAGRLLMGRNNGYFVTAKSAFTARPSQNLQLELSYQPLYSSAGSAFGFHLYRYHLFMLNVRYWLDWPGERLARIFG